MISGLGRAPGGGNGNPPQYSGMEDSMDRVVWQATVHQFSSVQSSPSLQPQGLQYVRLPNSQSLLKLMPIGSVMPSSHLILCCPLPLLPAILHSIRVFSSESVLHIRWPKCWSFNFSISSSNEYSGLNSFRMDWLNLLAALENLKSLLQHHSSKASILQHSAFFTVQLSHS